MTKNTMMNLVAMLNGEILSTDVINEMKGELETELNRNVKRAQANRELYAEAHDVVMNGLANAVAPVTVTELYEEIREQLPEGFKKGKVQYALLHYWDKEVVKIEGNPNTYKKA